MTSWPAGRSRVHVVAAFAAGALAVALFHFDFDSERRVTGSSAEAGIGTGMLAGLMSTLTAQAQQHLGDGEYLFLPNRRTIWAINQRTGRFANFHFRDDQEKTILISRVVSLDQRDFPPEDTTYQLSDRNLINVLWVCNRRTGDLQLWTPTPNGNVTLHGTISTSVHLSRKE